jgi:hypothetical protein
MHHTRFLCVSVTACVVLAAGVAVAIAPTPSAERAAQPPRVTAQRLATNPLVTVRSSPGLGDNVNGPSVIRVPSWIPSPPGRYAMYFAHHMGRHIRVAFADRLEGPWRIHEGGVLPVEQTALDRPQPDPPETMDDFYTHVASPDVVVDDQHQRVILWVHGWWTEGQRWPADPAAARQWARQRGYGQFTQVATSSDALTFRAHPAITRTSYLRIFEWERFWYAMSRLGVLSRSRDPLAAFDLGPNPFRDSPYANRVRHVALLRRGDTMFVFFSAIGDTPERILVSRISLSGDWTTWLASAPVEVLAPATPYECSTLPLTASETGDVKVPVRQLRDPAIFEDGGRIVLFYSICGEQGIAAAEITVE